ncbi:MAG: transposase [Candidatus Aminicenantes bacterium]|nr:transposase [Candidatus Aminicenantes bacterium]
MARIRRLKVIDENAYYHIISRTVGQEFLLGENEKEKLFQIIKKYSELFFVKVIGFAIMSNHFHLLVCMETGENFSDREVIERLKKFYQKKDLKLGDLTGIRKKLRNLSEYTKCIKQTFSSWYNRRNNRKL